MNIPYETLKIINVRDGILAIFKWENIPDDAPFTAENNVALYSNDDQLLWIVNGMDKISDWNKSYDTFVGARLNGDKWQLISFGGNAYNLDMKTGKVTFSEFVK